MDYFGLFSKTGTYNSEEFTSGGTFDVPAGVEVVFVTGCAAGGGGGGAGRQNDAYSYGAGGGGSGEHCFRIPISVTPEDSITVTIGAGGAGGIGSLSGTGYNGSNGNDTSFGSSLLLKGGDHGLRGASSTVLPTSDVGAGGAGGGSLGGDGGLRTTGSYPGTSNGIAVGGAGGGTGYSLTVDSYKKGATFVGSCYEGGSYSTSTVDGGSGGGSYYGDGGDGGDVSSIDGTDGAGYGAGGGGGHTIVSGTGGNGGDGGDGYLLVEWFE